MQEYNLAGAIEDNVVFPIFQNDILAPKQPAFQFHTDIRDW